MKIFKLLALIVFSINVQGQVYTEYLKSVAFDREEGDRFGYSVAISGDYAIVGAYGDDFSPVDPNMGSAYIYEKTGIADWTFVQKINNTDQDDYDRFGWSVAIDGNIAVIGAYAEDEDEFDANYLSRAGSAYVFERGIDGVWSQVKKLVPSDREAGDQFGWSVSIDGNTAIIGAHYESHDSDGDNYLFQSGSAYVFDRLVDGTWIESQKIVASDRSEDIVDPADEDVSDQFGHTVSISGDYIVVGAPNQDYDAFGGVPLSETGAAYIFERTSGIWTEVTKIQNNDRSIDDHFGYAVGIDNNTIVVGAFREDENEFGASTMTNAGSAYLFERSDIGIWTQTQKIVAPDRNSGDRFGFSVSISEANIAIGSLENDFNSIGEAPLDNAGATYVYNREEEGDPWLFISKIVASDRTVNDLYGQSVSISGPSIIVGAFQQSQNETGDAYLAEAGAAYFYSAEACETSTSEQTLTLCEGETVIVGPFEHEASGTYTDVIPSVLGCDSIVTTHLTITPAPFFTQSAETCFGYPFTVGSSTYHESGTYTDTLTSESGCDSLIITNLTVKPENAVEQDVTICWGESFTIGASTYFTEGTYTDILTSSTLCDSIITTNLSIQLPVNNAISQDKNLLMAELDEANYQWVKCDPFEIIVGANEQSYLAPAVGQYAVIITDGSCTDTSSCVYVSVLSTDELQPETMVSIFPNPSRGIITIRVPNAEAHINEITIFDQLGQKVYSNKDVTVINTINLDYLSPGTYLIQLNTNETMLSKRLIIN